MSDQTIIVSASPHVHSDRTSKKLMYDVVIALIPAFLVSLYVFGFNALIVTAAAVISCLLFEYLIQRYLMKTEVTIGDGSALITGILLAFNLPAGIPVWMVVIGSLVAIGVAKLSFGGGRVQHLQSGPRRAGLPPGFLPCSDDPLADGSGKQYLSHGCGNGRDYPGAYKRRGAIRGNDDRHKHQHTIGSGDVSGDHFGVHRRNVGPGPDPGRGVPHSTQGDIMAHSGNRTGYHCRDDGCFLVDRPGALCQPAHTRIVGWSHSGGFLHGHGPGDQPGNQKGMVIFALGIGVITVVIRLFGSYPEGISFAILIMNAFVPLINSYFKPRRFGSRIKAKIM